MWDAVEVVSAEMAMQHARITTHDEYEDVELKLRQAHDLVFEHINRDDEDWTDEMLAWTTATVPKVVQAAVLCQFVDLIRYRGDDQAGQASGLTLSPYVTRLLLRYHDPAIA